MTFIWHVSTWKCNDVHTKSRVNVGFYWSILLLTLSGMHRVCNNNWPKSFWENQKKVKKQYKKKGQPNCRGNNHKNHLHKCEQWSIVWWWGIINSHRKCLHYFDLELYRGFAYIQLSLYFSWSIISTAHKFFWFWWFGLVTLKFFDSFMIWITIKRRPIGMAEWMTFRSLVVCFSTTNSWWGGQWNWYVSSTLS